ncbi:MAG TPA: malto-oligosyltrehalose synthase [Burkholderiales bacterium]|nr:malto-oligosyltrehalose synthase [Burkholderiales bacterium]
MNARLAHLAALHGIGLEYHDIWGNAHQVPETSLVALLGAMEVDATSEGAVESAITAREAARWHAVVPPAIVVRAGEPEGRIRLNLPAELDGAALGWRIEEEGGARHEASLAPGALSAQEHATVGGTDYVARELVLELGLPLGYHRFEIIQGDTVIGTSTLAAAPRACYRPPVLEGEGKAWGAAVQLYGVRSERNWGIGDYTDLRTIVGQWGRRGAGIVGVSPLHALYPDNPAHASPYGPSSRLFKNVLYLDVEAIDEFRECDAARTTVRSAAFQARLKSLRDAELVDYPGVAAAKFEILERLYAHFRTRHLDAGTARARAFRAFQEAGREPLRRLALFEALQERFHREDSSIWGWPAWPAPCRDPASPACARFAEEHSDRVEFFQYLQWQADLQLAAVGRRSFELGLGVGLYEDLAVSIDRGGAEAWANQDLYAVRASVGAPPDDFNLKGQDWGLPPIMPGRLRAAGYAPFIATLRANMRHAGALRIDHVMGLARLFWVPLGGAPAEGAYVGYPFADLLGLLALESHRNRCLVIGEDLGTVPDAVRDALGAAGVLSYRVLYFERQPSGAFRTPGEHPRQALITASTHDLPTLAGWWAGRDLAVRAELGLFPTPEARDVQVVARSQDRAQLLIALEREGLLPAGATVNPASAPEMTPEFARAIAVYLARSAAQVMVVQLEDVLGVHEQANLPGATEGHPNWRRKLPLPLERWPEDKRFAELARALARLRGRTRSPGTGATTAIIPRATYRLQLHRDFTFADAAALVPYLAELGVSHVYCSPYLRARPGSRHGYDIVDHASLNPEIGNRDDFDRLVAALKEHGLGQIVDMVPNHMGVMGADNAWWMDVLENGPASAYAEYFDIDWNPIDPSLAGKVLVPVLGDHYGNVLERGELTLAYEPQAGSFAVWYHEHRFPIDPREYPRILARVPVLLGPGALAAQTAADFESLIGAFGHLPSRGATGAAAIAERSRDKEVHKARLARLAREHAPLADAIERAVRGTTGTAGERASFAALDELLEAQAYRLASWRVAADEINYRRFFDINELAALRTENEAVFEATHGFVLELAAAGKIDGLRIDHPDGLYDPAEYFRRVQARYAQLARGAPAPAEAGARPLYVVAEKIVAHHEQLPDSWPVYGTTGYRFANVVNGLFVDGAARSRVDRAWRAFVGDEALDADEAAYRGKRLIMHSALAGELTVLANRLLRIARGDRRTRDFTFNSLRQALAEVVACFPVYRTYIAERVAPQDRRYINWAVTQAKRRSTAGDPSVFDFLKEVLLMRPPEGDAQDLEAEYRRFAMRFQQFTAPVMAKGVEDTAFYAFNRLVSLNEVGSDPNAFGMAVSAFHGASADRAAKWPHTMLATSTHDSKRSEDVRARIDVISELPAAWRLAVRRWSRMNRSKKRAVDGRPAPSRNDEYLLYQTLAGTFPAADANAAALATYLERIERYMLKAVREAKVYTSWINPSEAYESAVAGFVQALLGRVEGNLFLDDFRTQASAFAWYGALNSLSMALIKLTSPGVPDIYQGHECIELALVDPDNRRAVDYASRRAALESLKALAADAEVLPARVRALLQSPHDGRAKLWITWRALELRRRRLDTFEKGDYYPIAAAGARTQHVVAYARRRARAGVVAVAGRLFASLGLDAGVPPLGEAAWGDTTVDLSFIPAGTPLENALTGESLTATGALPLAQAFAHFPGAIFAYETPAV